MPSSKSNQFHEFKQPTATTEMNANARPPLPAGPRLSSEAVNKFRLILHPTCVIKPAVDGCPLVAANSMEIEKVRSFLLQIREKDQAALLGGIVRVILSPHIVFPK
jgi:hypothetical protein